METSTISKKTNNWSTMSGYIWALIGSAVGFANILSFSAKAYLYGGGAFLIPFTVALFVLGIPLLCLEGIIGQYFNMPLVSSYGKVVGKIGKFLGWLSILAVITIGGYYVLLTGWTIAYAYFSATHAIPHDTVTFLNTVFLKKSSGIEVIGDFAYIEFICTALVAIIAWWIVSRNISSGIERTCSIFLPLLALMVMIFTGIVCFLPGAFTGFAYYLIPDFSVLAKPRLWLDAFGHIFFSLSLGLGIITGYSRYAHKEINIARSMFYVALGDFLISFIAGFAIFGCVGYLSTSTGTSFANIVTSASPFEMGFVIFPTILKLFGSFWERIIGLLFFFCIFIAGITGVFSILESIAGTIEVEFNKSRKQAVTIAIIIITALAALFCMGNGQYLIGALEPMVAGFNMLIAGIAEILIFIWWFKPLQRHAIWSRQTNKKSWIYYCIAYFGVLILITVFAIAFIQEFTQVWGYHEYVRWIWFAVAVIMATILARK